jgi:hypothetical protein
VFRDDHDAALARLKAVEDELARERDKDVKQESRLASLEAQLAAAKEKLRATEAELAKHKPPEPRSQSKPAESSVTPRPPGRGAAIAAGMVLVLIVIVGIAMMRRGRQDHTAPSAGRAPAAQATPFMPDQISDLLNEMRTRANEQLPGARLVQVRSAGITPDGTLHDTYGKLDAVFQHEVLIVEPEVDPNVPIGAAPRVEPSVLDRYKCVYISRTTRGWEDDSPLNSLGMCALGDLWANSDLQPRCSMRSIWQRAIADGAPRDAIAEISFTTSNVWNFRINDQRMSFAQNYVDDCTR